MPPPRVVCWGWGPFLGGVSPCAPASRDPLRGAAAPRGAGPGQTAGGCGQGPAEQEKVRGGVPKLGREGQGAWGLGGLGEPAGVGGAGGAWGGLGRAGGLGVQGEFGGGVWESTGVGGRGSWGALDAGGGLGGQEALGVLGGRWGVRRHLGVRGGVWGCPWGLGVPMGALTPRCPPGTSCWRRRVARGCPSPPGTDPPWCPGWRWGDPGVRGSQGAGGDPGVQGDSLCGVPRSLGAPPA